MANSDKAYFEEILGTPVVDVVSGTNGPDSPARSPKGNIRNIKAMSDIKLVRLAYEMKGYQDPEAQDRIADELRMRGITL